VVNCSKVWGHPKVAVLVVRTTTTTTTTNTSDSSSSGRSLSTYDVMTPAVTKATWCRQQLQVYVLVDIEHRSARRRVKLAAGSTSGHCSDSLRSHSRRGQPPLPPRSLPLPAGPTLDINTVTS